MDALRKVNPEVPMCFVRRDRVLMGVPWVPIQRDGPGLTVVDDNLWNDDPAETLSAVFSSRLKVQNRARFGLTMAIL